MSASFRSQPKDGRRSSSSWISGMDSSSRPKWPSHLIHSHSKGRPVIECSRVQPYQTLKFRTAGSEHPALDLWNVYVPLDKAQRSNRTFGLMMIRRPSFPGLLELFWPIVVWFSNHVFAEDRQICEQEQAAFDRQGADLNHEIFPVIRGLRKVLIENSPPLAGRT